MFEIRLKPRISEFKIFKQKQKIEIINLENIYRNYKMNN